MAEGITPEEVLEAFRSTGALLEGHFLLSSGRHSARYLEKALVLRFPGNVERMCAEIARRFADSGAELVIGPTTLGVVLAYETAKHLGCESLFAERGGAGRELRRGFRIRPGQRVLIVDDILTTGGSVQEVLDLVRSCEGIPVGVGILVDRSGGRIDFAVRTEALLSLDVPSYEEAECPLCRAGLPLVKPGSTPHPGRNPAGGLSE